MKRLCAALFLMITFFSCSKDKKACDYDPCLVTAPASEVTQLQNYLTGSGISATQHCSGMFYTVETPGTGVTPNICSIVSVKYKGQLTNGNVFDQTTTPTSFQLGSLIESWKKGIPLIKNGGKIKLYVPPSLGYGNQDIRDQAGNIVIPANSILIFEVELVGVG